MDNFFENSLAQSRLGDDWLGEGLVFLVSQPRSGSTLLQRLLSGHPDIQTSAETWLMLHPVYGLRSKGIETDYRADWAATGVNEFLENYADGRETYLAGIRSFARSIYGRVLQASDKSLFLDKTPRYTMIVPELVELFPNARFIFLLRNPLAVLCSELHTYIGDEYWRLADFNPDLLDAPDRLVAAQETCGSQGITVHYEDLVANPQVAVSSICDHLDITFTEDMLDYGDTPAPRGRMNDPVGIHKHSKPATDGLQKWKAIGQNAQHRDFALGYLDDLGGDTLTALDYDPAMLRSEIENATIKQRISPIYPWKLATKPRAHHNFKDRLFAAYCIESQKNGRISGFISALMTAWQKIAGMLSRIFGAVGDRRSETNAGKDAKLDDKTGVRSG